MLLVQITKLTTGVFQEQPCSKVGQRIAVGRSPLADLSIRDPYLSRIHFEIECSETECQLRDLESRHGTQVNGAFVTEISIGHGDIVVAGDSAFRVSLLKPPFKRNIAQQLTSIGKLDSIGNSTTGIRSWSRSSN